MISETNSNLPSGLPVIDSNGKVIGVTNSDGTISITDIDYINEVINKKACALSVAFKEEKENEN